MISITLCDKMKKNIYITIFYTVDLKILGPQRPLGASRFLNDEEDDEEDDGEAFTL